MRIGGRQRFTFAGKRLQTAPGCGKRNIDLQETTSKGTNLYGSVIRATKYKRSLKTKKCFKYDCERGIRH
jgi:hypothetical protein